MVWVALLAIIFALLPFGIPRGGLQGSLAQRNATAKSSSSGFFGGGHVTGQCFEAARSADDHGTLRPESEDCPSTEAAPPFLLRGAVQPAAVFLRVKPHVASKFSC